MAPHCLEIKVDSVVGGGEPSSDPDHETRLSNLARVEDIAQSIMGELLVQDGVGFAFDVACRVWT